MSGDLRVEVRFKNAVLYNALRECFEKAAKARQIYRGHLNIIGTAATAMGVGKAHLGMLLNLQKSPWSGSKRHWAAVMIAEYLAIDFDVLFPSQLYAGNFPRLLTRDVSAAAFLPLCSREAVGLLEPAPDEKPTDPREAIDAALLKLSPRQEKIARMRFGLDPYEKPKTLQEIGDMFHLSKDRIRQIEAQALGRLTHPAISKPLSEALGR